MSGMEMLLLSSLKAFMPKEAAERIYRMAEDGTLESIGNLPGNIEDIKRQVSQLNFGQARIFSILQEIQGAIGGNKDAVYHDTDCGLEPALLTEHRADARFGNGSGASVQPDSGNGGSTGPLRAVGE